MANSNAADTSNKVVAINRKRSVMAEDILIEGNIVSQGVLEFGGQITGNLTADAVILTSTARVQGRVRTRTLTIEGDLRGAAIALHISVKKGSHVRANLAYETLEIEPGSNVTGEYTRISADTFKL